jgi:sugar phosphate permease
VTLLDVHVSAITLQVQLLLAGLNVNFLSQIDSVFVLFYAFGAFYAGSLCERFHTPTLVGLGLMGSGACTIMFACGIWTDFIKVQPVSAQVVFMVCRSFLSYCV